MYTKEITTTEQANASLALQFERLLAEGYSSERWKYLTFFRKLDKEGYSFLQVFKNGNPKRLSSYCLNDPSFVESNVVKEKKKVEADLKQQENLRGRATTPNRIALTKSVLSTLRERFSGHQFNLTMPSEETILIEWLDGVTESAVAEALYYHTWGEYSDAEKKYLYTFKDSSDVKCRYIKLSRDMSPETCEVLLSEAAIDLQRFWNDNRLGAQIFNVCEVPVDHKVVGFLWSVKRSGAVSYSLDTILK